MTIFDRLPLTRGVVWEEFMTLLSRNPRHETHLRQARFSMSSPFPKKTPPAFRQPGLLSGCLDVHASR